LDPAELASAGYNRTAAPAVALVDGIANRLNRRPVSSGRWRIDGVETVEIHRISAGMVDFN